LRAYQTIVTNYGYVQQVMRGARRLPTMKPWNYSDEELAFLAFYPLLKYERDPALRAQYRRALTVLWRHARSEHNPLWNYIYAAGTGSKVYGQHEALETLERIPLDTIYWTVDNSQRLDLSFSPLLDRQGSRQSLEVIPPDERCTSKWNGNPFELDCNEGGRREDDGTFFLLPYWLGRYYGLIRR
jgi:hypothetical protein